MSNDTETMPEAEETEADLANDFWSEAIAEAIGSQEDFTPYEAAKVASKLRNTYVREQMLYQYVAKGRIASHKGERQVKKEGAGPREVKVIDAADLADWLRKYLTKVA